MDEPAVEHGRIPSKAPFAAPVRKSLYRKLRLALLINLIILLVVVLISESSMRLFGRSGLGCDRWFVGSGQTRAGFKWWPETTYWTASKEFRVSFRTNALGYRARPTPHSTTRPRRIAFVGDSFTEAKQVEYERTFCALIERELAGSDSSRETVCENFGIAATGLFDYWHRIIHDVLRPDPPDVLVLCIYPGNDFCGDSGFPDDGFGADGEPLREYFQEASWLRHAVTWMNLKSRVGQFLVRQAHRVKARLEARTLLSQGPPFWWADRAVAASAPDAPAVRRSRALLRAIDAECHRHGTKLCVLVVGPVLLNSKLTYAAKDGQSPLARLMAEWQIDAPVIDVAVAAGDQPHPERLIFPRDGHLNEAGHEFVSAAALPPLRTFLGITARREADSAVVATHHLTEDARPD